MPEDLPAKYYKVKKEGLQKTYERCQSLCKLEKGRKQQYDHERYKNLPEKNRQKLYENYKMRKNALL